MNITSPGEIRIAFWSGMCKKVLSRFYVFGYLIYLKLYKIVHNKQLCEKLIRKMSRKRNVPFLSGRMEIWAAAVIHALGSINFLFDTSKKMAAKSENVLGSKPLSSYLSHAIEEYPTSNGPVDYALVILTR